MCGTLSRNLTTDQIVSALNIKHVFEELPPAFNIKPSQRVLIVREEKGERILQSACWWLTPQWVKDKGLIEFYTSENGLKKYRWKGKPLSMFNLRLDNVTNPEKPTWRKAMARKRCIIVADAFVEWPDDKLRDKEKDKIPGLFFYKDRSIIGMAGFWECVPDDEGKDFFSSCLITLDPNAMLKALPHHRMPAMLRGTDLNKWLDSSMVDADEAAKLCRTTPEEDMDGYFISKAINVGVNNSPEVQIPIGTFNEENAVVSDRNRVMGY